MAPKDTGERLAVVETRIEAMDEKLDELKEQQALFGSDLAKVAVTIAEINERSKGGFAAWISKNQKLVIVVIGALMASGGVPGFVNIVKAVFP